MTKTSAAMANYLADQDEEQGSSRSIWKRSIWLSGCTAACWT
jgi:hypothetical protein